MFWVANISVYFACTIVLYFYDIFIFFGQIAKWLEFTFLKANKGVSGVRTPVHAYNNVCPCQLSPCIYLFYFGVNKVFDLFSNIV